MPQKSRLDRVPSVECCHHQHSHQPNREVSSCHAVERISQDDTIKRTQNDRDLHNLRSTGGVYAQSASIHTGEQAIGERIGCVSPALSINLDRSVI